mmetsp:Transcript_9274/g.15888  ORF Transcript_9274/g.15888 Transcript_9274/m.15888 type:complete len:435 (+) Transcript_9274:164-1468(+)
MEELLPCRPLGLEPHGRSQVFHTTGEFALQHPLLQGLSSLRSLSTPLVVKVVETFVQLGQRELRETGIEELLRNVRQRQLAEGHLLLLGCQRNLGSFLFNLHVINLLFFHLLFFHFNILGFLLLFLNRAAFGFRLLLFRFLLGLLGCLLHLFQLFLALLLRLLFGLLRILLFLLQSLLAGCLFLFLLELGIRLLLLILQHQLQVLLLEFGIWSSHDHIGSFLEGIIEEVTQGGHTRLFAQVASNLHNDVIPLLERGHALNHPADAEIIHVGDAKTELRLIVVGLEFGCRDATLLGPIQDHAIRELGVVGMLRLEHVQPVEAALLRQTAREDHLEFAAALRSGDRTVADVGILYHVAGERQGHLRAGAKVDTHCHVSVVDGGKQDLAVQTLGQGLRLTSSFPIFEEANGEGVRAGLVQINQHRQHIALAISCWQS